MKVYLAQLLCPARRCILAAAMELETPEAVADFTAEVREMLPSKVTAAAGFNEFCDLCRAPKSVWRVEVGPTHYATLAEAWPHLQKVQEEQRLTNQKLRASDRARRG